MLRFVITLFLLGTFSKPHAQTLGGNTAFPFLKLPAAASITAAGGISISHSTTDVADLFANPALLQAKAGGQLHTGFTPLATGVKAYTLGTAYQHQKSNTTFGLGVFYVNYAQVIATDASGNTQGQFNATDFEFQISAGRTYLQRWQYGTTLKLIQGSYGLYKTAAFALDVGLAYRDTANGITLGLVAKNMGVQIKTFAGAAEDLPFDLQFGITKKLADAPFAFSVTVQQMHRSNLMYADATFGNETDATRNQTDAAKAFQHVILASHIFISKNLEATVGYNQLRRSDFSFGSSGNGLEGFSAGFTARFEKLQLAIARATYQRGHSYTQLGLTLNMNSLFGLGKL